EDGIRDRNVTGVQTCALPIYSSWSIAQSMNTSTTSVNEPPLTPSSPCEATPWPCSRKKWPASEIVTAALPLQKKYNSPCVEWCDRYCTSRPYGHGKQPPTGRSTNTKLHSRPSLASMLQKPLNNVVETIG